MTQDALPLRKLLISALVVILVIFVPYYIFVIRPFHVTSTNPSTSNVSVVAPFFKIRFNHELSATGLSVTASSNIITSHFVSGKTLTVLLNSMNLNKTYTITITSVGDTAGHVLRNKVFTFTTKNISYDQLPSDQQQAILAAQGAHPSPTKNNPILSHLPYGNLDFSLSALVTNGTSSSSVLVLQAKLLLSVADVNSDEQAAITQYKQEVLNYITSLGLNPSNYSIQYEVVSPSQ